MISIEEEFNKTVKALYENDDIETLIFLSIFALNERNNPTMKKEIKSYLKIMSNKYIESIRKRITAAPIVGKESALSLYEQLIKESRQTIRPQKDKTFYYHKLTIRYDPNLILSAYMVDNEEMDESEFKSRFANQYYGKVIKYFEDDMYSLCNLKQSDYEVVKGIDLSKDGIYIEDFEYRLFAVVIDGEIVLQIEK